MNLIELTTPASGDIPVSELAEHLRLGTGFADDGAQDTLLEAFLRAAIANIEGRTGKVLLTRQLAWDVTRWIETDCQGLPVAPVQGIDSVVLVKADGTETAVGGQDYFLRADEMRPKLAAQGSLPSIPGYGVARITFQAGFGDWAAVPADLKQAVLMLSAYYYENRHNAGDDGSMPFGVLSLIDRYRTVRLMGDRL